MTKITILGGTGFIGQKMAERLSRSGHSVFIGSRNPDRNTPEFGIPFRWDPKDTANGSALAEHFKSEKPDWVINLSGESIAEGRWSTKKKKRILDSRVHSTRTLVKAIETTSEDHRPKVVVQGSAVGYYGIRFSEEITEKSPAGDDFLADVCVQWEKELAPLEQIEGVRTAIIRTGVVLDSEEGAFPKMVLPFRMGVGGKLGSGSQGLNWIHIQDLVEMFIWAAESETAEGIFNGVAPQPVTNEVFTKELASQLKRPAFFPMPGIILELVVGEFAQFLLQGPMVYPQKTQKSGFEFRYDSIDKAIGSLVGLSKPIGYVNG